MGTQPGHHSIGDCKLLENVQRRATKLAPALKDLSYEDRLRALDLPSLYYRPGGGGGGVLSPFDGGGVRPEKKYRGVRELLFIPKKGGVRELE